MQQSSFFDSHTDAVTLVLQKLDHKNTKLWVDKRVEELETQLKATNKAIHDLKWSTIAQDPPAGAPYVPPLSFFAERIDALNTIMKQRDNLFVVLEEVTKLRKCVAWIILHRVDGLYGTSYLQSAFPSRNRMCEKKSVEFITKALQSHYMRRRVRFHAEFCWTGKRWIGWKSRHLWDHWVRVKQRQVPKRR